LDEVGIDGVDADVALHQSVEDEPNQSEKLKLCIRAAYQFDDGG
jgi:hypothetical protein